MTEVIRFTQETCRACATQREKNERIEAAYPDVDCREIDIQTELEAAIEDPDRNSTGFARLLTIRDDETKYSDNELQ